MSAPRLDDQTCNCLSSHYNHHEIRRRSSFSFFIACDQPLRGNISPLARFFARGTNAVSCVVTYHELKALLCDGGIAMPCLISQGICTVFRALYNVLLYTCDCAFQSMYTCMCIVQCGFAYMHKAQSALHFLLWLYIAPYALYSLHIGDNLSEC